MGCCGSSGRSAPPPAESAEAAAEKREKMARAAEERAKRFQQGGGSRKAPKTEAPRLSGPNDGPAMRVRRADAGFHTHVHTHIQAHCVVCIPAQCLVRAIPCASCSRFT